jgi:CubicO group peptidase (beta-lactamase class C family)
MKKTDLIKGTALFAGAAALGYGIYYCWASLPVATGFGAKILGSALFVAGRKEADIRKQELRFPPVNLVTYNINYLEATVTSSLWGLARQKAVFRQGLGITLVRERTEEEIRSQSFQLPALPAIEADTLPWPAGDKISHPVPPNIDTARLANALAAVFPEKDTAGIQTRAVVVLYQGQLIAERYAPGFTRHSRLPGWSMTKSITNALIGILVKQNKLQVNQPAPVPEWRRTSDPRQAITIKHLLQHTSGLSFEEHYAKSSHVTRMLFQKADMGAYAASLPLQDAPGTVFRYASGNSNILSRLIRHTVGEQHYHAFAYEQLFYKAGMYSALLEPDASGTFVSSSFGFATARDWARFGLLYLNDGVAGRERLFPDGWVEQSTLPATAARQGEYGFHFWLNAGANHDPANRTFPSLPADMFYASGFDGQNIFIIPSKKLVVVRLGLTRKGKYDAESFLANIIRSIG